MFFLFTTLNNMTCVLNSTDSSPEVVDSISTRDY